MSTQPQTGRSPSIPAYGPGHLSPSAIATAVSVVVAMGIPLGLLIVLQRAHLDFSRPLYALSLVAVIVDAVLMAAAGIATLREFHPPPASNDPPPPVDVIVLAPNGTDPAAIGVTVGSIRAQLYAGDIAMVLVYAADQSRAEIEALVDDGDSHRTVCVLRVDASEPERRMFEAALPEARGDIMGFYRAGQDPTPDTVERARRWIDAGCDVIVGHRAVLNAGNSATARTIAVEQQTADVVRWAPEDESDGGLAQVSASFWRTSLAHRIRSDDALQSLLQVRDDRRSLTWEAVPTDHGYLRTRWAVQESAWMRLPSGPAIPRYANVIPRRMASVWRPAYLWVSPLIPVLAVFWVGWQRVGVHGPRDLWPLIALLALWLCANPVVRTGFAYASAPPPERRTAWYLRYALLTMLYLDAERRTIARAMQIQTMVGRTRTHSDKQSVVEPHDVEIAPEGVQHLAPSVATVGQAISIDEQVGMPDVLSTDNLEGAHPRDGVAAAIGASPIANGVGRIVPTEEVVTSAQSMIEVASRLAERFTTMQQEIACLEQHLTNCSDSRTDAAPSPVHAAIARVPLSVEEIDELSGVAQHLARDPESLMSLAAVGQQAQSFLYIVDAVISAREAMKVAVVHRAADE